MTLFMIQFEAGQMKVDTFQTKDDLFDHVLANYGPDCHRKNGILFGGCNSPDEGWGRIVGFESDDDFNSQFQKYVEDYCGHTVN